jgi:hypothetical protein
MREPVADELPHFEEGHRLANREQIDVQIYLHGRLMNGKSKQTWMVLAGKRIMRSLRRSVMLVTRWNGCRTRMCGRS